METVREKSAALYLSSSEGEVALKVSEPFVSYSGESSSIRENRHTTGKTSMSTQDESFRFDKNYVDANFECKDVHYATLKRLFDICVSSFFLIIMSPIMLITAVLVKISSPGPVIFKQIRVGRGGRYFWCYKFRSMCQDAEARKTALMEHNEASGPVFKIKNDPRVTGVGKWIRKLSIDELPQMFNVLQGDMSLVGPRPPLPSEVEKYSEYQRNRLSVKPGLTCLWQINGRSNVSFERWVELDLMYIEKMSFKNDIHIMIQTVPAVLFGRGAQ